MVCVTFQSGTSRYGPVFFLRHPDMAAVNGLELALLILYTCVTTDAMTAGEPIFGLLSDLSLCCSPPSHCCGCACRVEMLLRLFALGVWRGPHTYWANGYNRLDVAIIGSSWCALLLFRFEICSCDRRSLQELTHKAVPSEAWVVGSWGWRRLCWHPRHDKK